MCSIINANGELTNELIARKYSRQFVSQFIIIVVFLFYKWHATINSTNSEHTQTILTLKRDKKAHKRMQLRIEPESIKLPTW